MKPPEIAGFYVAWCDEFYGPAGSPPNSQNWTLQTSPFNWNLEWQRYTNSTDNAFLDGNGQLVISPQKVNGQWTSASLHGNHNFGCDPNRKMIFAARIKLGQNPAWQQQGIWPAWWALGQSMRRGIHWYVPSPSHSPVLVHQLDTYGNHAESHGYVDFDRRDYHTWAILIDLSDGNYSNRTISYSNSIVRLTTQSKETAPAGPRGNVGAGAAEARSSQF
ncbi:uncharacterized protein Z519_08364 [Cladophialophora bantiana CBS 173.52]|uniref:GH16 domain-containing protein n=1 Tax=Cladophialophora bantiana (strain ATCC 10958 / CBS 173.52 / CDC B-1940 / NIH 8579) TaxID=1442370 RepID=A0A0D2EKQ7_CLAB1|nr:uncharacterized protein Z519_08364 [Cladophialophora bantiana CBS 173.52]KIW90581.1 hypothetical protein Z519_08364 [Cladophialophora bantiana CBS 173.52]